MELQKVKKKYNNFKSSYKLILGSSTRKNVGKKAKTLHLIDEYNDDDDDDDVDDHNDDHDDDDGNADDDDDDDHDYDRHRHRINLSSLTTLADINPPRRWVKERKDLLDREELRFTKRFVIIHQKMRWLAGWLIVSAAFVVVVVDMCLCQTLTKRPTIDGH
ncbi:hypothetical protein GQX74_015167 [Glossina fuscipes]|nr:hypothetical protein GQX74_015167 [Glossina fuscipes]